MFCPYCSADLQLLQDGEARCLAMGSLLSVDVTRRLMARFPASRPAKPSTGDVATVLPGPGASMTQTEAAFSRPNAIFVEGLGTGGLYSLNYERLLGPVGLRAGVSYAAFHESGSDQTILSAPFGIVYLLGERHWQ